VATDPGGAPDFSGKTLREVIHTSVGGEQVRVWFSNRFGTQPLQIGAAHVGLTGPGGSEPVATDSKDEVAGPDVSGIQAGSDRSLTFHHRDSVTIPPGAEIVSDPVTLNVPALSDLSISIYLPDHTMATT